MILAFKWQDMVDTHCSLVHFPLTRVCISGLAAEQLHTSSGFIFRVSKLASNRKVPPKLPFQDCFLTNNPVFFYCIWHTSWTLSCNLGNRWWRIKFLIYDWLSLYQYNQKEAYENPSDPLFYVIEIGSGLWVLGPIANTLQCSIWQLQGACTLIAVARQGPRSQCMCVAKLWLTLMIRRYTPLPCHERYTREKLITCNHSVTMYPLQEI